MRALRGPYTYALACMPLAMAAVVNSAVSFVSMMRRADSERLVGGRVMLGRRMQMIRFGRPRPPLGAAAFGVGQRPAGGQRPSAHAASMVFDATAIRARWDCWSQLSSDLDRYVGFSCLPWPA